MASDARKKEKKRLKRKQKQEAIRKANLRTPLSRIAVEGGRLECWATEGWKENGMASILVLAHAPGGKCAFAAFLVDLWCVGLKDCWGEAEITELEFRESMLEQWQDRYGVVTLDPAVAKRLVRGGVRFCRQNGFKLPAHWDRWVSVFGQLGSVADADLSDFGKDGGLQYVGNAKFLRERLIGCTPEQFLSRPDVKWTLFDGKIRPIDDLYEPEGSLDEFGDEDDEDESEEDEEDFLDDDELEEGFRQMRDVLELTSSRLSDAVRKWCFANGQAPSPKLEEGAMTLMASIIPVMPADDSQVPDQKVVRENAARILAEVEPADGNEMIVAMNQVAEFVKTFPSPDAMLASVMGSGEEESDDQNRE